MRLSNPASSPIRPASPPDKPKTPLRRRIRKFLLVLGCILAVATAAGWWHAFHHTIRFDPVRMAAAESRMWQAYYQKDQRTLALELVTLLRGQFGLTPWDAARVGIDFGRAASAFQSMRSDYERVLPDLERGYTRIAMATGRTFDPAKAASAELDWWVARRTGGRNRPQAVGQSIAHLYAVLYGVSNEDIVRAGQLRAEAAHLRDSSRSTPDWARIENLLLESYQALLDGIGKPDREALP